ncbi:helix-turn-helix domain-containing protein [Paenibacillus hodogayensis]|uniref:Helix-turn-helix domain-containing protein n=1 Tax=Paenibacillus hodogayensis TaxID=279208 RepID=A0ABV5VZ36_9BACL
MRANSLFTKLLAGFLAVIVLLLSFNVLSYTFFYRNLRQEITTNSTQNLNHIVEQYEKQFQTVQLMLVGLFFHNQLTYWQDPDRSLANDAVNQLVRRIRDIRENEMLYLQDLIIQYKQGHFLIHQGGPDRLDSLYVQSYRSEAYGPEFWRKQFDLRYQMRVYAAADFYNSQNSPIGRLIPFVLKSTTNEDIYITALLDADKMFGAFSSIGQAQLHLIGSDRSPVFRSAAASALPATLPAGLDGTRDYVKADQSYYFYRKGAVTGLSYILVIPNADISGQMSRINVMLSVLLVLALVVSITLSVFVSIRFYTPIQNIIQTIQRASPEPLLPARGKGDELHFIDQNIKQFLRANRTSGRDPQLPPAEGYIRKLNSVYAQPNDLSAEHPYYMIVFRLSMTRQFRELHAAEQDKAARFIKEFISVSMAETFPESVTLLVEKDRLLSLLFTDKDVQDVWKVLERLRLTFDRDKEYCYLTLAFRPQLHSAGPIGDTYGEMAEMVGRRKLLGETQILTSLGPEPLHAGFPPAQEQELYANLQAGQGERATMLLNRMLQRMSKEGATGEQMLACAKEVVAKTVKLMAAANVEIGAVLDRLSPYPELKECATLEELQQLLDRFVRYAAGKLADKKEEKDTIVEFVTDTIRQRYNEDLSLDRIADRLGLTPSYVSRYIKEKTGSNFSDLLNEVRIKKAKELLGRSNVQVRDIATRVGYVNVTSFIRMFKKVTGLTPSDYRKAEIAAEPESGGQPGGRTHA